MSTEIFFHIMDQKWDIPYTIFALHTQNLGSRGILQVIDVLKDVLDITPQDVSSSSVCADKSWQAAERISFHGLELLKD